MFNMPHHNEKTFPSYDERLYNELLNQFNDNPFINNPQSTTNSQFVNKISPLILQQLIIY